MGHRSWLTPVNTKSDYKKELQFSKNNYGVNYVIHITKEGNHPWELGDVIISWSGEAESSKEGLKPDSS
jgi:hypothetical protein